MICLICRQSSTESGLISVELARGECRLLITEVPARVCPGCGEAYVEESVATQLLSIATQRCEAGILEDRCKYLVSQI